MLHCRTVQIAIVDDHHAGVEQPEGMGELDIIRGLKSIRWRDWRDGNPNVKCPQHYEGVVDTVRGKDGEGAIRTKPVTKQALGKSQNRSAGLGIADGPLPVVGLLDEKDSLRGFARPEVQPIAHAMIVVGERLG